MNVIIVEDEQIAAEHLRSILVEINPAINVKASLDSIESAVNYFESNPPADLIIMDIELGDGQSFDIFKRTSIDTPVIFTTAYEEHALRAFKLNSIDYLLKPVAKSDLNTALIKYEKLFKERKRELTDNLVSLLKQIDGLKEIKKRYLAKNGTRLISVAIEDIAYFYTKDRLQYIKTSTGGDFILDRRLDEIEIEVDSTKFFRANRQFILSYNCINKVHSWFSGKLKVTVLPEAYEEIIISRLRSSDFKKWLGE